MYKEFRKTATVTPEYVPFGEEWRKEMHKLPKDFIINMLRVQLLRQ